LADYGERALEGANITFKALADEYERTALIPPKYIGDRKVAGQRSYRNRRSLLGHLRAYFGKNRLREITPNLIQQYRLRRLDTPIVFTDKEGKETVTRRRSISAVNRELQLLRRILNVAVAEGLMIRNPFSSARSLISSADERKRERILTREEEERLLAACSEKRERIRPILICAIDTGMRKSEMLKLKWSDVDLVDRIINVIAFNTKTARERQLAMTERLARELERLWAESTEDPDTLVFGIKDNIKKAFTAARSEAGIPDVRLHDLRHTHATRLIAAHIPLGEVGRVLGHTQPSTTYRYVNANHETTRRAAAALDFFNNAGEEDPRDSIN
jgi:integrase